MKNLIPTLILKKKLYIYVRFNNIGECFLCQKILGIAIEGLMKMYKLSIVCFCFVFESNFYEFNSVYVLYRKYLTLTSYLQQKY